MTLGLQFPEVRLFPYTSAWADAFDHERERIQRILKNNIIGIEHVGSTAIPGIRAKPIIDIAVAVHDLGLVDAFAADMASIGYDDAGDGGVPGQRIFGRGPRIRTHLVHFVVDGSEAWRNYLAFREALLGDRELAKAYDSLKHSLAAEFPADRRSYTSAKSEFIERVLSRATAQPGAGICARTFP